MDTQQITIKIPINQAIEYARILTMLKKLIDAAVKERRKI
jgi:hypothetical protein